MLIGFFDIIAVYQKKIGASYDASIGSYDPKRQLMAIFRFDAPFKGKSGLDPTESLKIEF